jgi:SpoVK/Ycf46/Vps4 family AAA+-type ATPase
LTGSDPSVPPPRPEVSAPDPDAEAVESALAELSSLVGLDTVKEEVRALAAQARVESDRRPRELRMAEIPRHFVMVGNPGTGKTTVTRLLAQVYRGYGLIERYDVKVVSPAELVGQFIGESARATSAAFDDARGGVLMIDDAQLLAPSRERPSAGEATDALAHIIEAHRDDTVVVLAAPDDAADVLDAHPALSRLFTKKIQFRDYTDPELVEILRQLCAGNDYELLEGAAEEAAKLFGMARTAMDVFDNVRLARRLFEAMVKRHVLRITRRSETEHEDLEDMADQDLFWLVPADVPPPSEFLGTA